jgi:hypothetical protein
MMKYALDNGDSQNRLFVVALFDRGVRFEFLDCEWEYVDE